MSKRKSEAGKEVGTHAEKKHKTETGPVAKVAGLEKVTLEDILTSRHHKQKVFTLEHNNNVATALEELAKHKILSAPVLLAASLEDNFEGDGTDSSGTYMGMLSVDDIVRYLARHIVDERKEKGADNEAAMKSVEEQVFEKPVQIVMGRDTSFVFNKGSGQTTLAEAISEGFLQGQARSEESKREMPHVHRLAVFDIKGRITAIVSQSDVVSYLVHRLHLLGDMARKTLSELKLAGSGRDVVSVKTTDLLLDAFVRMADERVSAVAVVDKEGKLVGNLSASDLRGFSKSDLEHLDRSVSDFLLHRAGSEGKKATSLPPVITVKAEDSYEHVLKTVSQNKVHRCYVTDEKGHPTSPVTLSDLLRVLV